MRLLGQVVLFLLVGFGCCLYDGGNFIPQKLSLPGKLKESLEKQEKQATQTTETKQVSSDNEFTQDFSHIIASSGSKTDPSQNSKLTEERIKEATEPLKETIANLTETNKRLETLVDSLNSTIKSLKSQNARQTSECSSASSLVEQLKAQLSKAQANVTSLASELKSTQRHVTSLTSQLKETQKTVQTLKAEKSNLESQLESANSKLKDATSSTNSKPVLVDGCPTTFTNDKEAGICYGLITNHYADFDSAGNYCKEHYGGRLAVLDTDKKFSAVRNAAQKSRLTNSFWVGCHADQNNRMIWMNGKSVSSSVWAPGEPNSSLEKCGDLHYRLYFKMNDERCNEGNLFVCEVVISE